MKRRRDSDAVVELGGAPQRLTPIDVQQQQFRRSFRGYDEQEVDDFLDRVTEELSLMLEEKRAALGQGPGQVPVPGAGQVVDATRTAEDIKRGAREQAETMVRDAQARAAAILRDAEVRAGVSAPAGSGASAQPGGGSAALSAFVSREREFLQRLAQLVQGHAEGVKEMVQAARRGAEPPRSVQPAAAPPFVPAGDSSPVAVPEPVPPVAPTPPAAEREPGPPPEIDRPAWESEGGPASPAASPEPEVPGSAVVRVPEAAESDTAEPTSEAEVASAPVLAPAATVGEPEVEPEPAPEPVPEPEPEPAPEPEPEPEAEPEAEPEPEPEPPSEARWAPPEPPRLPDLPAPPEMREPERERRPAAPKEQPVPVPRGAAEHPDGDDDDRRDPGREAEREATLRELFWGED